ncbi:MAG: 16S rRNA (guanine(966)-N(2))-methyltransferase RsmD [Steroidobacteraceae bacterium]|nr:16S rRNA (guanine(966)-N(2))-methyltransferase RsmD [Steroidobacteraceae bacterium]MDW8260085.1 16S rRNA (guanine(966)-N(2))-methyltransferase RsmD [Gammaproteobacteria bacterium]
MARRGRDRFAASGKSIRELRVIGGAWRGRKWRFVAAPGVRPTPDRVRETLFNWLAARIGGAHCLDLFAGSGALGTEALSRGAADVMFVDRSAPLIDALRARLRDWGATGRAHFAVADALEWLASGAAGVGRIDIAFLDPPFAGPPAESALGAVIASGCLARGAWVYLEQPATAALALPRGWTIRRRGRAGAVGYYLLHES